MSTQQDNYAVGSESRPPMLNKENYVPWSSRLLRYAKSRPNGKLIHNSILNGPYVRRMIPEPGDANREVTEIWLRVQQIMKGSDIGIQEKKAKLFNERESAPVYDTDGSAEVHENCNDDEISNMFTQEEQYTELLEPIPESHQVPQNDNDVISEDTSVEQCGKIVEQHPANFEETRALYESLYQNLAIEV
nr:Gag-Pol polyprotein [Tanacetum cinerariifolium]